MVVSVKARTDYVEVSRPFDSPTEHSDMELKTWRSAQNLQVAALDQGSLLGRLSDFQFDLQTHEIYG